MFFVEFLTRLFLLQAPSSLLEALEQHLASLEGKKTKELSADNRCETLEIYTIQHHTVKPHLGMCL